MTRTLRRPIFVMAVMVISAMWFASAAQAGAPTFSPAPPPRPPTACDTRNYVVTTLGEKYGEAWRGGGLSGPTAIFEIWASDKPPRTWTILKTTPDGIACIMAVGDSWHDDTGKLTPIGDPA